MVGGTSTLIGLSISKALSAMVRSMTALAGGDSGITIRGLGCRDEIGEMAAAVGVFKDNMIDTERLRSEQTEAAQRQASQRKAEMNTLVYPTGSGWTDRRNGVVSLDCRDRAAPKGRARTPRGGARPVCL
jgi:HAMP domain-containing protein